MTPFQEQIATLADKFFDIALGIPAEIVLRAALAIACAAGVERGMTAHSLQSLLAQIIIDRNHGQAALLGTASADDAVTTSDLERLTAAVAMLNAIIKKICLDDPHALIEISGRPDEAQTSQVHIAVKWPVGGNA